MKYLILYIVGLVTLLVLDFLWLGVISKNFIQKEIGHLMAENFNVIAAGLFYLIYVAVLLILIVLPVMKDCNWGKLITNASLFGMICYATYDLTNLATLKNWPVQMTIVDILWGTFVTIATAAATYYASIKLF